MDYAFTHEGKNYTPNQTEVIDAKAHNEALETMEVDAWKQRPERYLGYFSFPVTDSPTNPRPYRENFYPILTNATITTWTGVLLGRITRAHVYRHNFGQRFVSLTMQGTNGACYHGRASYDWGQCINLRKCK